MLASKGHYGARFRSLFGDVPVRVPRMHARPCQGLGKAKSFAALDLGKNAVALRQRGSLTIWFSDEAIEGWRAQPRTTAGGQP